MMQKRIFLTWLGGLKCCCRVTLVLYTNANSIQRPLMPIVVPIGRLKFLALGVRDLAVVSGWNADSHSLLRNGSVQSIVNIYPTSKVNPLAGFEKSFGATYLHFIALQNFASPH